MKIPLHDVEAQKLEKAVWTVRSTLRKDLNRVAIKPCIDDMCLRVKIIDSKEEF